MTVSTVHTVSAEELLHLPDDGFRYELIRGELKKMPPAGHEHGNIAMRQGWRLAQHVELHDLGTVFAAETGFLLSTQPDTVRAPDVAFVRKEREAQVEKKGGYWPGAPDLVVEVISPGDRYTEVEEKAMEWLEAGVRLALIVNPPRRTVTVCRSPLGIELHAEKETLDLSEVLPDFSIKIADIFG